VGTETEDARLECHPGNGEGRGEDKENPESLEEDKEDDEEEGEVTAPPHSLLCEALPSFSDIFRRQTGVAVSAHQQKRTDTEIGPSISSPL
jgi:hypothetical protein